jgi:hypothetical protein
MEILTHSQVSKTIEHYKQQAKRPSGNQAHYSLGYVDGATSHWQAILNVFDDLARCVEDFHDACEPKRSAPYARTGKSPRTISRASRSAQKAAIRVCETIGAPVTARRVVELSQATAVLIPKVGDAVQVDAGESPDAQCGFIEEVGEAYQEQRKYGVELTIKLDDGCTVTEKINNLEK